MFRSCFSILLLWTSVLSGCQTIGSLPVSMLPSRITSSAVDDNQGDGAFDLNGAGEKKTIHNKKDKKDKQKALENIDHELVKQMIDEAPTNAQVCVVIDFDHQYCGILHKRNADNLELLNSVSKEAVPGPAGQKQCKTSHLPFQSFKIASITRFMVISPPAPGFISPDLTKDTRSVTLSEIVYKDGRHQRLGAPPESNHASEK